MSVRVTWVGERTFIGTSDAGHSIVFGARHGEQAHPPGPGAMELVLIGTGGCSSIDVVSILEKARQPVDDVSVELQAERAEEPPRVFTRIHMHFTVRGRGLSEAHVARAISLSVEKYCSAAAMMARTATITHDYEIIETGT